MNPFKVNGVPALFDKANGFLIVLPDNAELTSEISSADMARATKIINLRSAALEIKQDRRSTVA
jgi:hypothetical protein